MDVPQRVGVVADLVSERLDLLLGDLLVVFELLLLGSETQGVELGLLVLPQHCLFQVPYLLLELSDGLFGSHSGVVAAEIGVGLLAGHPALLLQ